MFKKTDITPQLDMFEEPSLQMGNRASKKYSDPKSWHNRFYHIITSKIDEEIFKPLFKEGRMGAPNSSIRVLVAMSILKEGFGCSDEDLFEKCEFDLLTRKALGLLMLGDAAPSIDTYYLFRRRICEYEELHGVNLMAKCFEQVAGEQAYMLKISGKCVRMDSKLIGSNIAHCSRYELIHDTLVKFLNHKCNLSVLRDDLHNQAEVYIKEDSAKTVYRSDKDTLLNRLYAIGEFIYNIMSKYETGAPDLNLLKRVFDDQYDIVDNKVTLRDSKKISSDSLQSPYDADAAYRNKHGQKVRGYVTNITETVEDGKPSIITSVQTEPATFGDCKFLEDAVANSEKVTGDKVEELYADGAYQSPDNREFAIEHDGMKLKTGKMQGGCRFILHREDGSDNLTVTDTKTGEVINATYIGQSRKHGKRWRIPLTDVKQTYPWRYFSEKDVAGSELRQKILSLPEEELYKRNNIEAAMFQYSFHTRNGKTRYRGLLKTRMQAYCRCLWMNTRRIIIFQLSALLRPFFALVSHFCKSFYFFWKDIELDVRKCNFFLSLNKIGYKFIRISICI